MNTAIAPRVFLTSKEVMVLMGCSADKAYRIMRQINKESEAQGYMGFVQGKVNKHIFAEKFRIPEEEIEKAIEYCKSTRS